DWVSSLLLRHNGELRRVSKYCAGLALAKNIQVTHLAVTPYLSEHSSAHSTHGLAGLLPRLTRDLIPKPQTGPLPYQTEPLSADWKNTYGS
ncbi:MAG: hypothetical protein ACAI44_05340, partial [Candidatus Sericytochromatia bacterium]